MTKPATPMKKQQRAHYTDAYREEALLLAERVGVATAARDLGLPCAQPVNATVVDKTSAGVL